MRISELVLGVVRDGRAETLAFDCRGAEPVKIAIASAAEVARAVRETIAAPERTAAKDAIPFIRVTAQAGALQLELADDAAAKMRVLTETRAGAMPLIIEAKHGDEESIDALLARVALAADAADSELLLTALASETVSAAGAAGAGAGDEDERAYASARRRASELQKAVRAIDDRMTQSVVPDWIWIATTLGGIGVLMTVVALLYPELRVVILPVFVGLSVLGFAAYGLMSWRELKKRGALLVERRELRARREAARAEARAFAARGVKMTEELELLPAGVPLIHAGDDRAAAGDRQVLRFIDAGGTPA